MSKLIKKGFYNHYQQEKIKEKKIDKAQKQIETAEAQAELTTYRKKNSRNIRSFLKRFIDNVCWVLLLGFLLLLFVLISVGSVTLVFNFDVIVDVIKNIFENS